MPTQPHRKKRKASLLSSLEPEPDEAPTDYRTWKTSTISPLPTELRTRFEELGLMLRYLQELHEHLDYRSNTEGKMSEIGGTEKNVVAVRSAKQEEGLRRAVEMLQGIEANIEVQKGLLGQVKEVLRLLLEDRGDPDRQ